MNSSRRSFLYAAAAAGAIAALPASLRAQVPPLLVFDPAVFGKAIQEAAQFYEQNKLMISRLVFAYREYELAREDHAFSGNINDAWSFLGPQVYQAQAAALQHHKITNDTFRLFQISYDAAPGLWNNDFSQVEFGFQQYLQYENSSMALANAAIKHNLKAAAKVAAASNKDAQSAMTAVSRTQQYQHSYAQLMSINNGVGLLTSTISTGVQTMLQNAVAQADFAQKKHQASSNAAKSFLAGLLGVNFTPSTASPGAPSPSPSPGSANTSAIMQQRAAALAAHLHRSIERAGSLQGYLSGRRSLPAPGANLVP